MVAIAVSPPCINSSESLIPGSIQPVPVVVATTRIDRSQALVRSSSATTLAAVASRSPSGSRPPYTRIGTRTSAGSTAEPAAAKSRNSARVGPCATNSRPAAPSVAQLSSESGDPDRSASIGGTSSGSTASLADE